MTLRGQIFGPATLTLMRHSIKQQIQENSPNILKSLNMRNMKATFVPLDPAVFKASPPQRTFNYTS